MLMQEKERVTEEKTGILDPVIPGQTDMKKGEEKGTKIDVYKRQALELTTAKSSAFERSARAFTARRFMLW